jgi:AraC family transcriptional regulator of adaptative response/methylated-DNA-[protein]-cysteine methyltransferase
MKKINVRSADRYRDPEAKWDSVLARDRSADGEFVYGVSSTGVYCRPSCPSRRPARRFVQFFDLPADAQKAGYRACLRCKPDKAGAGPYIDRIRKACAFIDERADEPLTLETVGKAVGLSPFHLQRSFKRIMGISPRQYRDARRMKQFKAGLKGGRSVTDSIYQAGFGSSSRLYERASAELGMTPASYGKKGDGNRIDFTVARSGLGLMLIAATDRGICMIGFGDDAAQLEEELRDEFARAVLVRDDKALSRYAGAIRDHLDGRILDLDLPLDVKATAFQRKVWEQLRRIPYGDSITYSELANRIGSPGSVRAVARACATNPVSIVVPCHRVVQKGGGLAGYRWGVERKQQLLSKEKARLAEDQG